MRLYRILFASTVALLACGGGAPHAASVPALPSASPVSSAAPAVDLSPVGMPANAVALIRVTRPAALADVVSTWAGQALDPKSVAVEIVGERIAKLVELDGPADMLISLKDRGGDREPDATFAVALDVGDFAAAKSQLEGTFHLLPIGNGAFEIPRVADQRDGDSDFRSCALAPSPGGARVVCSRRPASRDAALPYLTRGLGKLASVQSDVHVEARPGPLAAILRRERSRFARAGARSFGDEGFAEVWQGVLGDLIDGFLDVDKATLDARLDSKRGVADLTITTHGARSVVTRLLTSHPERAEPPPASFLRLPADADVALFEHGVDADTIAAPKAMLLEAVRRAIEEKGKMGHADRDAMLAAIARTVDVTTAPTVYARGVDYAKAIPATSGLTEGADAAKIKKGVEQAAGWDILGVEEKPADVVALLKDWASLMQRASARHHAPADDATLRVVRAARGAPPGTVEVALAVRHEDYDWSAPRSRGQPKKRPPIVLTLHTLVVPDHGTAWLVSALDEATAVEKARELVGLSRAPTLAGRAGLDALKAARANAGGFVTPRGLGMGIPLSWLFGSPRFKVTSDPLLGIASPNQYTTPLVFSATEGGAPPARSLTLSLEVPRAAIADFLGVGPRIFH